MQHCYGARYTKTDNTVSNTFITTFTKQQTNNTRTKVIWQKATCTLTTRDLFAIECLRRSNQQGWVTLGQNLGRKGSAHVSKILTEHDLGATRGCRTHENEEIVSISFAVWAQCTNVTDRQTDTQLTSGASISPETWSGPLHPFPSLPSTSPPFP